MSGAIGFLMSVAVVGLVFAGLFFYGMPDLVLVVVGIGFLLGVIMVHAGVHSLTSVFVEHESELTPPGVVPSAPIISSPPPEDEY